VVLLDETREVVEDVYMFAHVVLSVCVCVWSKISLVN